MKSRELLADDSNENAIVNPPLMVWITLLLMLSFTAFIWHLANRDIHDAAQTAFNRHAEKAYVAVKSRMQAYEQVLRGGVGLLNSSRDVTRQNWHAYVAALKAEEYFPGIQGIGFSLRISPAGLQKHIQSIRNEGFPDYTVKPPGSRDEYTSIIYLEPFNERNKRAFGYDMYSEPRRRAAMIQARESGKTSISGKVVLVQETTTDVQAGFLMYLPLYTKNAVIETPEQRNKALTGYVYSPFRMNNLMRGILGESGNLSDIDLEIYDGISVSADTLMYDDDRILFGTQTEKKRLYSEIRRIDIAGHPWTLLVSSSPSFEATIDHSKSRIAALSGIAISLLFFVIGWSMSTNRVRAQNLVVRMRDVLKEQEALINAIVEDAADGIITIDETGSILGFNHTASQIFGYSSEEIIGKNVNLLMPEPYHSAHDQYLQNYLASGQQKVIGIGREVAGQRKNGEIFPMDLAVSEIMRGTRTRMFAGIVRDISQRKKFEEQISLSEERFNLAIRAANDGLWDWDMINQTSYHSPRWNAMLGFPEIETTVAADSWLELIHPDDRERAETKVRDYLDGHIPEYVSEHRMKHRDGYYVWILSRGTALRNANGKPYRMVGIYTDISKQKQMDNMKSEFVSTVSHELRTPLTSIRGSLSLIAGGVTGALSEQTGAMLGIALKNTERLLTLINDILDIEKIQSGKLEFNFKPQLLMPLIEQTLSGNKAYADKYKVSYILRETLPDAMVNVDGNRLMQVMANLLSNAAKFSHGGDTIDIRVNRDRNSNIIVSVTDHGVGIPEAFHQRIFEKFTQADSSDTRHKGGTGLGLSITKTIIESMHGSIGFTSQVGKGTTFFFELPEWHEQALAR